MQKKIKGDTVKWGIIGVGDVCEVKSAPAMQQIAHSELVAVMRRNGTKAKDFAQRHGVPHWYDDADKLINDPVVNAIYIATPPYAHEYYTIKAAQAGKPVYVEKPMACNYVECLNMIKVCQEENIPLYVAYYRRALSKFLKIKEVIDTGKIGKVRLVKIELYKTIQPDILSKIAQEGANNWRIDPQIAGGGYFFDLASHQLDYLDFLFGPILAVNGFANNQAKLYDAEDIVTGTFTFNNNIMGIGSWCFTVNEKSEKDLMTIIGSEGQIRIPFFGPPQFNVDRPNQDPLTYVTTYPVHVQKPLIESVINDLLGKGVCPSIGRSAARTNWVMEEMTKNYYQKNK